MRPQRVRIRPVIDYGALYEGVGPESVARLTPGTYTYSYIGKFFKCSRGAHFNWEESQGAAAPRPR